MVRVLRTGDENCWQASLARGGVPIYIRTFSPQTLAVCCIAQRESGGLPAPRYSAAMSKQPVRVVIRNRPTQESADNIMLEKDGKTVTIRQSTATVGGGAKQALQ